MKCRHFAISGGIDVNEWVDSCDVEASINKCKGCCCKQVITTSGVVQDDLSLPGPGNGDEEGGE